MSQGWQIKDLDKLAVVVNGGTPKTKVEKYWGGNNLWVTPAEMGKRNSPFISETQRTLSDEGLQNCSASLVPANSVIMSTRAPIGHLVINTEPMAFNQGCRGMIPGDELDVKYLYYFLLGNIKLLNDLGTGATFKELSAGKLKSVSVPYPSLHEQKRIVAILDEAFAGIDTAIANTGKNLANARELFESYLNSVFAKKGDGWGDSLLGEICDVRDGTHDSPKYVEDGVPFVTQKNIRKEGLSFETTKYITESDHENFYKRSNVAQGDVLISMIGANRGMACIVDDNRAFSIKNVGLIKANEKLNMRFILYYLKTSLAKGYIETESRGGAQPFIGLGKLRAFPVVTAPISDQNRLVGELDAVHVEISYLEKIYQQKLNSLKELKQSLLQKAFSGELTAKPEKLIEEVVA